MAQTTRGGTRAPRQLLVTLGGTLGLAALSVAASGCVSQGRFDEQVETTQFYQRNYNDLERYQTELEAEIEALRAELALAGAPIATDAAFSKEIDRRLADLEEMEARIAGVAGDGSVKVVTFEGGYGYRMDDSVLFGLGSAEVSTGGRHVLEQLRREIQNRPYDRIWVRGHTDTVPIVKAETKARFPRGNLELSVARAMEVAGLLVGGEGLDPQRVVVAGFGPSEPTAPNDVAEGRRKNRRVEIYVEEGE